MRTYYCGICQQSGIPDLISHYHAEHVTAYVKPWDERASILRQIKELAEDSDWVRVSDIEELLT